MEKNLDNKLNLDNREKWGRQIGSVTGSDQRAPSSAP